MSSQDDREIRIRGGKYNRFIEVYRAGLLHPGMELMLVREPDNPYDPRAVAVGLMAPRQVSDGGPAEAEFVRIGHISADQVKHIYWRLDRGAVIVRCTVLRIDERRQAVDARLIMKGGWQKTEAQLAAEEAQKKHPPIQDLEDDIPF